MATVDVIMPVYHFERLNCAVLVSFYKMHGHTTYCIALRSVPLIYLLFICVLIWHSSCLNTLSFLSFLGPSYSLPSIPSLHTLHVSQNYYLTSQIYCFHPALPAVAAWPMTLTQARALDSGQTKSAFINSASRNIIWIDTSVWKEAVHIAQINT